jgi:Ser/Thr protein kinase RdoA (MazF antagonist)
MDGIFCNIDLLRIAEQYDSNALNLEFLRKSHNYTYKVICPDSSFILRLSSEQHRSKNQILSELDFQYYLHKNGASVVSPLITNENECIIPVLVDGHMFYATAFSWAEGLNWDNRSLDLTLDGLFNIGKELGKIHRLSMNYKPENVEKRRLWNENQHLVKAYEIFKAYDIKLYGAFIEYMDDMRALSKDESLFGLTHGDYLLSNYMIVKNARFYLSGYCSRK